MAEKELDFERINRPRGLRAEHLSRFQLPRPDFDQAEALLNAETAEPMPDPNADMNAYMERAKAIDALTRDADPTRWLTSAVEEGGGGRVHRLECTGHLAAFRIRDGPSQSKSLAKMLAGVPLFHAIIGVWGAFRRCRGQETMKSILNRFALSAMVIGSVAIAGAQTYGNTEPFEVQSNHSPNYVLGVRVVIPQAITLQSFGMIYGLSGDPSDSNAIFGLYSSNPTGGLPLNLMAVTNPILLTTAQTYDNIAFTSTPTVAAGTYWMMALYESQANPRTGLSGQGASQVAFWTNSYSSGMPSSAGSIQTYYGQNLNYWVNGVVPEPASLAILGAGTLALLRRRRRWAREAEHESRLE